VTRPAIAAPNCWCSTTTWCGQRPGRTLASGIADAMAKWYEASVSSGGSGDGLVQQAVQMARVLRDQLLLDGAERPCRALAATLWHAGGGSLRPSRAGLIGGIGGARCRTVAAHAVHNGLTQLPASHGHAPWREGGLRNPGAAAPRGGSWAAAELAAQARRQLLPFFAEPGPAPVRWPIWASAGASLQRAAARSALLPAATAPTCTTCRLPVGPADLLAALVTTTTGLVTPIGVIESGATGRELLERAAPGAARSAGP
jgi:glycerol dehydrogenase